MKDNKVILIFLLKIEWLKGTIWRPALHTAQLPTALHTAQLPSTY